MLPDTSLSILTPIIAPWENSINPANLCQENI